MTSKARQLLFCLICIIIKAGHEETEENLINFLESRLQDHERLRGGLHYVQHIPRDENWKVIRSVLQQFVPPARPGEAEGGAGEGGLQVAALPGCPALSPRTRRAAEAAEQLLNPTEPERQQQEPEEIFGMRSRSRRGSEENILAEEAGPGEGETERAEAGEAGEVGLTSWLKVTVLPDLLERELLLHPAVAECLVRGVAVQGVGLLPRAYITLKPGFPGLTAREILVRHGNVCMQDMTTVLAELERGQTRLETAAAGRPRSLHPPAQGSPGQPARQSGQVRCLSSLRWPAQPCHLLKMFRLDMDVVGEMKFREEDKAVTNIA